MPLRRDPAWIYDVLRCRYESQDRASLLRPVESTSIKDEQSSCKRGTCDQEEGKSKKMVGSAPGWMCTANFRVRCRSELVDDVAMRMEVLKMGCPRWCGRRRLRIGDDSGEDCRDGVEIKIKKDLTVIAVSTLRCG